MVVLKKAAGILLTAAALAVLAAVLWLSLGGGGSRTAPEGTLVQAVGAEALL